jgi:cell wall assembly regulator SMI1
MRQLNWLEPGQAISASLVHEAEKTLGLKFPPDYVELITRHNGASNPKESSFHLVRQGRRVVSNFGALISLQRRAETEGRAGLDLYGTIRLLGHQLPERIVPFALTGHGDFICFDYRSSTDQPTVVYFSHEAAFTEHAIVPLVSSVSDFLDLLHVPPDI